METPIVQFQSFINETTSPEELEQLGQRAVAWLERERLAGLQPCMHEPSLTNLLNGVLPPPSQVGSSVNENGERTIIFAPESEDIVLPNARTVWNVGARMLFFGYDFNDGDCPDVEELRARSKDAIGLSVMGGRFDED
ncbi:MAG: hypothetical protein ABJK78_01065 [Marinobacter alexandrii]